MKILILGASGLIGSNIFNYLSSNSSHDVFGTYRNHNALKAFEESSIANLMEFKLGETIQPLDRLLAELRPDVIINALGVTKHIDEARANVIRVNSLFPHQLAEIATKYKIRLIHISTDCVFSGSKGMYTENDVPDAIDLYGRSKILGEVNYDSHLTLRISTIGTEITSQHGLLEWFLASSGICLGYTKAVFSGLPSKYFADVLERLIFPNTEIFGLYHIASYPIDKYTLLGALANFYNKKIKIVPNEKLVINRSLDPTKFVEKTGYVAPSWDELIKIQWL